MKLNKAINNFIEVAKEWNRIALDEEKIHFTLLGMYFLQAMVDGDVTKCNQITDQLKMVIQNKMSASISQDTITDTTI